VELLGTAPFGVVARLLPGQWSSAVLPRHSRALALLSWLLFAGRLVGHSCWIPRNLAPEWVFDAQNVADLGRF